MVFSVVVGTYQLDEAENRRDGNIQLFKHDCSNAGDCVTSLCQVLEMPHGGVLDCKVDYHRKEYMYIHH
jgi:hypothetical protein